MRASMKEVEAALSEVARMMGTKVIGPEDVRKQGLYIERDPQMRGYAVRQRFMAKGAVWSGFAFGGEYLSAMRLLERLHLAATIVQAMGQVPRRRRKKKVVG